LFLVPLGLPNFWALALIAANSTVLVKEDGRPETGEKQVKLRFALQFDRRLRDFVASFALAQVQNINITYDKQLFR
jgi:hypothetical protein